MSESGLPIVVVGAGPVGLAAAAELLEQGLDPLMLEAGEQVGTSVRAWGHVRLFSPWEWVVDPAAQRLLEKDGWTPPDPESYPNGAEWVERYLAPLAEALGPRVVTGARVIGVAVLGRLGYSPLIRRAGTRGRAVLILGLLALTTLLLAVLPGPPLALIAAAMLAGAARGIYTLLQATALSDRWPARYYGRLNGILTAPVMLAIAISPWAGSALADLLGGYPPVFVILAAASLAAAMLALATVPAAEDSQRSSSVS